MEFAKDYYNFKPTHKYFYCRNNNINEKDVSIEDLFNKILTDVDIVFNVLKIPPSKIGYAYWRDAIIISILSEKDHLSMCNEVYPMIAKKHNKSRISIERAMRLCFEDTMYNSKKEENFILDYLRHFLVQPQNNIIMAKITEMLVSDGFYKFKKSLKY